MDWTAVAEAQAQFNYSDGQLLILFYWTPARLHARSREFRRRRSYMMASFWDHTCMRGSSSNAITIYQRPYSLIATNQIVAWLRQRIVGCAGDNRGRHVTRIARPSQSRSERQPCKTWRVGSAAVRRRRRRKLRSEREAAISNARRSTRTDNILHRSSYASCGQLLCVTVSLCEHDQVIEYKIYVYWERLCGVS